MSVVAHAPLTTPRSGKERQYDLIINQQSFFDLPCIYDLGVRGLDQTSERRTNFVKWEQSTNNAASSELVEQQLCCPDNTVNDDGTVDLLNMSSLSSFASSYDSFDYSRGSSMMSSGSSFNVSSLSFDEFEPQQTQIKNVVSFDSSASTSGIPEVPVANFYGGALAGLEGSPCVQENNQGSVVLHPHYHKNGNFDMPPVQNGGIGDRNTRPPRYSKTNSSFRQPSNHQQSGLIFESSGGANVVIR